MKKITIMMSLFILATVAFGYAQSFESFKNIWSSVSGSSMFSFDDIKKNNTNDGRVIAEKKENPTADDQIKTVSDESDLSNNDAQDQITYNILFNFVRINEYDADQMETNGPNGTSADSLRNLIKNQVNLTDTEYVVLKQVANDYAVEMAPVHTRAMEIIKDHHREVSMDTPNEGTPSEVPQELIDLNNQRNSLTLQFRNTLRTQLGEMTFARFKQGMDQNFVSQLRPLPESRSIPTRNYPGEETSNSTIKQKGDKK